MGGAVGPPGAPVSERARPVVCSIGTTDPWNAAGLGLDIALLHELGARPVTVVAGVSAQDGRSLTAAIPLPPAAIGAQFAALARAGIGAVRIGALLDPPSVVEVARLLRTGGQDRPPSVLDPVLATSAGGAFADTPTVEVLRRELIPLVTLLTPNLNEAEALLGRPVADVDAMAEAARDLAAFGPSVLVKGGHLAGAPVDVLWSAGRLHRFEDERLGGSMRGTGCALAVAIAVGLAEGRALLEAVRDARCFVREKIRAARVFGGMRVAS